MTSKSIAARAMDIAKHERQYVENFIIVSLNIAAKKIPLLQEITNNVEIFFDPDTCIDYITSLKNERVLFVVSDLTDRFVVTLAQDLPAVSAIYVVCSSEEATHHRWFIESIRKVKGVYTDISELIEQMKRDIRHIEHELIGLEIVDASTILFSRNLNKQECSFMYSQLLKDVFLKFQDDNISEMVDYCRTVYRDKPCQLALIEEFKRDYNSNKAIWWYTRDSFVYKMINKALRTQHIETLYSMRTFIRHLHEQLIRLCSTRENTQPTSTLTLYRGQKMLIAEFEKLKKNVGGLLSISNFLSTSTSRELAQIYAGESDNELIAIVFVLTLNPNDKTNSSFACIEEISQFGESEHEWLFSMGSVFRIGKIELLNGIWYSHLMLTNDQDETIEKLTVHMGKIIQIQHENPLIPLCRLFARMGEYQKAEELCKKNSESENGWEVKATLYDTLGLMYADEEDQDLALSYHQQALDVVTEHVDKNDPILASYHNNVAISCSAVNQDEKAIEHYQIAIDLESNASQPDYTNIAYSYESMGDRLYYSLQKYDEALHCYKHALELMLVYLPCNHPDIFALYDNMATIYEKQNKMDKALEVLYKCCDAKETSLEYSSRDLVFTYRHIAKIYKRQNRIKEASEMLAKCRE